MAVTMADLFVIAVTLLFLLRLRRLHHQHIVNRQRRECMQQRQDRRRFLAFQRIIDEEDRRLMIRQLYIRFAYYIIQLYILLLLALLCKRRVCYLTWLGSRLPCRSVWVKFQSQDW